MTEAMLHGKCVTYCILRTHALDILGLNATVT